MVMKHLHGGGYVRPCVFMIHIPTTIQVDKIKYMVLDNFHLGYYFYTYKNLFEWQHSYLQTCSRHYGQQSFFC